VAQIGGELAKAQMATHRGSKGGLALATAMVDKTVQLFTQIIYTFVGLGLLALERSDKDMTVAIWTGIGVLTAMAGGFLWLQRQGLFGMPMRSLERIGKEDLSAKWGATAGEGDAALRELYRERALVIRSTVLRLAFRFALAGEVWICLKALGHPVGLAEAIIIESLTQAVWAAAFAIPAGLGAQEGGVVAFAIMLGMGGEVGVALAMCKRMRELIVGVPGILAWQWEMGKSWLKR